MFLRSLNKCNTISNSMKQSRYLFLPTIVLRIKQEICTDNGNTHRHNDQDEEYQKHETKHEIYLVCPERGEDEVPEMKTCHIYARRYGCILLK